MAMACLASARAHASAGQPVEMQEAQPNVAVHVHVADAVGTSGGKFTCWNIDASKNRGFFDRDLDPQHRTGPNLVSTGEVASAASKLVLVVLTYTWLYQACALVLAAGITLQQ